MFGLIGLLSIDEYEKNTIQKQDSEKCHCKSKITLFTSSLKDQISTLNQPQRPFWPSISFTLILSSEEKPAARRHLHESRRFVILPVIVLIQRISMKQHFTTSVGDKLFRQPVPFKIIFLVSVLTGMSTIILPPILCGMLGKSVKRRYSNKKCLCTCQGAPKLFQGSPTMQSYECLLVSKFVQNCSLKWLASTGIAGCSPLQKTSLLFSIKWLWFSTMPFIIYSFYC